MKELDVVVVGGGPTGMTLGGDLARSGRSVAVIERWPSRNPSSRAFATMSRTLEVLDSRGLADELLTKGAKVPGVNLWPGAAIALNRLPSRYPFGLVTPQTNVDQLLETYARAQGANIIRGAEVIGLEQDADGVSLTVQPKGGGERTTWRAPYVVGADGAHSTVRRLIGVDFPGKSVLSSVILADVHLKHPPLGDGLTLGNTPEVFGFLAPYGDGWFRSMTWDRKRQLPDGATVDDAEIGDVLNRAMGRDVGVSEIRWRSRFHCDERQVASYRHGRVFLAGDAAHVHSPMGGQGMNTGIQDAANLAWKLDLVLGGANDAILDTYQSERHPIGQRVLLQSGAMMRAVTLESRVARGLRNLIGTRLLSFHPFADLVAGSFSGVSLRYNRRFGEHALVGTRAAQVPLREGRLTTIQRTPGFLLVREKGTARLTTDLAQAERTDSGPALLVRPDGYIAWAGSTTASSPRGFRDALDSWVGGSARKQRCAALRGTARNLRRSPTNAANTNTNVTRESGMQRSQAASDGAPPPRKTTIRVLQTGLDPDLIDFSSPAFSQFEGLTHEKLRQANDDNVSALRAAGFEVDNILIDFGETAVAVIRDAITRTRYDAVLIGAGVRLVPSNTLLFEALVNLVHTELPSARFVFNYTAQSTPNDMYRWFPHQTPPGSRTDTDVNSLSP